MKIYIMRRIAEATTNWHPEGGVAVIARDLARAKEVAAAGGADAYSGHPNITDEEWGTAEMYELSGTPDEKCWVFPDAGCC